MTHQATYRAARRSGGFTLIELMITMAIIAVIAGIALPSYNSYVQRARRADARGQLMQAAQFMQRFYSANDSYLSTRGGQTSEDAMPANLKQSPADSDPIYDLTVEATGTAYTLTMAPVAGKSMASDACGKFTITSAGVRGVLDGTKSRDECWK